MASNKKLPYVAQPGTVIKILQKIKEAKTPERFTQDFLKTKLGLKGGMIFFSKSGHKESDEYNHFWRCSNGKSTQAVYEGI